MLTAGVLLYATLCYAYAYFESITLFQKSISVTRLNNRAKFHPHPIWNDGALGFLKRVDPTRTGCVAIWGQFLIQKRSKKKADDCVKLEIPWRKWNDMYEYEGQTEFSVKQQSGWNWRWSWLNEMSDEWSTQQSDDTQQRCGVARVYR